MQRKQFKERRYGSPLQQKALIDTQIDAELGLNLTSQLRAEVGRRA